jgi:serine/threonine protein kinase
MKKILKALSFLHKNNISHGDLKLSNIMIDKNQNIKLIDFAFSKMKSKKSQLTNDFVGTPAYMAPEQLFSVPCDGKFN